MRDFDPDTLADLLLAAKGATLTEESRKRLRDLHWALVGAPLLFRCHTPGVLEIGDPEAPTVLHCGILAAAGAQLALACPGSLVRACDFAAPGIANVGLSVRAGLKRFARYLEANGQRPLASAVLTLQVKTGPDGNEYIVAPMRRLFDIVGT